MILIGVAINFLLKEPVVKRLFIIIRLIICKILSIKVNNSLAVALENVGGMRVFSVSDLKF